MNINPQDPYKEWDAAYVLGSLSVAERREFELHLADCDQCSAAVSELAGLPGLLSAFSPQEAESLVIPGATVAPGQALASNQAPATAHSSGTDSASVLPLLAKRVRQAKARRRTLTLAAAAAVVIASVGGTIAVTSALTPSQPSIPQAMGTTLDFSPVSADSVTVSGTAAAVSWGTEIRWRCKYLSSLATPGYSATASPYELVVIDKQGKETIAASWDGREGAVVDPITTVSVPLANIASIEVRWADSGKTAVRANL